MCNKLFNYMKLVISNLAMLVLFVWNDYSCFCFATESNNWSGVKYGFLIIAQVSWMHWRNEKQLSMTRWLAGRDRMKWSTNLVLIIPHLAIPLWKINIYWLIITTFFKTGILGTTYRSAKKHEVKKINPLEISFRDLKQKEQEQA